LKNLGLKFEVVPSTFQENYEKSSFPSPVEYVKATANAKADEVCTSLSLGPSPPDLIISADTIVVLDTKILEKPSSYEDAKNMLKSLSGRSHVVYTAVCLVLKDAKTGEWRKDLFAEKTDVFFAQLSPEAIDAYVQTGTPMDKAGGYGIQEEIGSSFISHINGCFWNVTGFPIHAFCQHLLLLMEKV